MRADLFSHFLQKNMGWEKRPSDIAAQLTTPCAVQLVSTPLHLFGLDLYNRSAADISGADRMRFIRREYTKTALARIARIFPAYGIGGVTNSFLRSTGRKHLGSQVCGVLHALLCSRSAARAHNPLRSCECVNV